MKSHIATITFHVGPASLSESDKKTFLLLYDMLALEIEKGEHLKPSVVDIYISDEYTGEGYGQSQ